MRAREWGWRRGRERRRRSLSDQRQEHRFCAYAGACWSGNALDLTGALRQVHGAPCGPWAAYALRGEWARPRSSGKPGWVTGALPPPRPGAFKPTARPSSSTPISKSVVTSATQRPSCCATILNLQRCCGLGRTCQRRPLPAEGRQQRPHWALSSLVTTSSGRSSSSASSRCSDIRYESSRARYSGSDSPFEKQPFVPSGPAALLRSR